MAKYNRNITELREKVAMWWPEELKTKNAIANVLPLLLKTQEDFLRLIVLSKNDPFQLFDLINVAKYPSNLFLKHLAVLADYGGEPIQRSSAISTICNHSDCTVAYTLAEFKVLSNWIKSVL